MLDVPSVTDGSLTVSVLPGSPRTPDRYSTDQSSIDACLLERTNRSRFGQMGFFGSVHDPVPQRKPARQRHRRSRMARLWPSARHRSKARIVLIASRSRSRFMSSSASAARSTQPFESSEMLPSPLHDAARKSDEIPRNRRPHQCLPMQISIHVIVFCTPAEK